MTAGRFMGARNRGLVAACGIALALATGCGRTPGAAETKSPASVETVVVSTARHDDVLIVSGVVARERESALGFRTGGLLAELTVEAGDAVRRGQVIGRLDDAPFRIRLRQAAAELERATRDAERYQILATRGFISQKRIDDQLTAVAEARAAHDTAVFEHRWSRMIAPASGVILSRSAQAGEIVQPGQTVVTLADASSRFVLRAPVADRDVARIKVGAETVLLIDGLPGQRLSGRILRIGEAADPRSAAVMTEIAVPATAGLRSGMIGRAQIVATPQSGASAGRARVPTEAIVEVDGADAVVFRVDRDGVARRTKVKFAGFDGDDALLEGLAAGARLITSGAGDIDDGDRVNAGPSAVTAATTEPGA